MRPNFGCYSRCHLSHDPDSRVACESLAKTGMMIVAGEITSNAKVSYTDIAREVIREIGYTDSSMGFDGNTCAILTAVEQQSPDISQGVTEAKDSIKNKGPAIRDDVRLRLRRNAGVYALAHSNGAQLGEVSRQDS